MSNVNHTEPKKSNAKLYWTIGIVVAVLVAALLLWNSSLFNNKNETAAIVGDQEYSSAEVGYYYAIISNSYAQQAQQYSMFGMSMGYDPALPADEQFVDEESGTTYADFFLDSALQELQRVTILCNEAEAAGYTLSEDGQAALDENMNILQMYSIQNYMEEEAFIKASYGSSMTKDLFVEILTNSILADEFAQVKRDEFAATTEELDAYYAENTADMDSYDYRVCNIYADIPSEVDEEGNPIEPTEEETAAAIAEAKEKADALVAGVQGGAAFNETAAEVLGEEAGASYSDPAFNLMTGVLGSSVTSSMGADCADWLKADGRTAGEITSIEMEGTGYCVVQFLGRDKGEDNYQTMSYQTMMIPAEMVTGEDGTSAPTEETLAAAEEQAKALLADWESGEVTDFGALATETITPELVEDANRDVLDAELSAWLFDEDRQVGDATVVSYTDANGAAAGYQLVLVEAFGDIRWVYHADNALRAEAYNAWFAELQEACPAELTEAAKEIPNAH